MYANGKTMRPLAGTTYTTREVFFLESPNPPVFMVKFEGLYVSVHLNHISITDLTSDAELLNCTWMYQNTMMMPSCFVASPNEKVLDLMCAQRHPGRGLTISPKKYPFDYKPK